MLVCAYVHAQLPHMLELATKLGLCLHVLEGHIGVVRCLAMKEDILVSGGDRKRLIVWDIKVCVCLY